jgi:uncharacterized sulfatase
MRGVNLLQVANNKANPRETVFGEIYEHDVAAIDHAEPGLLYRWCVSGNWKLILPKNGTNPELYDLSANPGEKNNLADSHPEEVKMLTKRLQDWWGTTSGGSLKP